MRDSLLLVRIVKQKGKNRRERSVMNGNNYQKPAYLCDLQYINGQIQMCSGESIVVSEVAPNVYYIQPRKQILNSNVCYNLSSFFALNGNGWTFECIRPCILERKSTGNLYIRQKGSILLTGSQLFYVDVTLTTDSSVIQINRRGCSMTVIDLCNGYYEMYPNPESWNISMYGNLSRLFIFEEAGSMDTIQCIEPCILINSQWKDLLGILRPGKIQFTGAVHRDTTYPAYLGQSTMDKTNSGVKISEHSGNNAEASSPQNLKDKILHDPKDTDILQREEPHMSEYEPNKQPEIQHQDTTLSNDDAPSREITYTANLVMRNGQLEIDKSGNYMKVTERDGCFYQVYPQESILNDMVRSELTPFFYFAGRGVKHFFCESPLILERNQEGYLKIKTKGKVRFS